MAARVTIKAVNDTLCATWLPSAPGGGERLFLLLDGRSVRMDHATVPVDKIGVLTLEQWIAEYKRLKKLNAEMLRSPKATKKVR
jgi:hypothetical protein